VLAAKGSERGSTSFELEFLSLLFLLFWYVSAVLISQVQNLTCTIYCTAGEFSMIFPVLSPNLQGK
jgi:hypothetical protein